MIKLFDEKYELFLLEDSFKVRATTESAGPTDKKWTSRETAPVPVKGRNSVSILVLTFLLYPYKDERGIYGQIYPFAWRSSGGNF